MEPPTAPTLVKSLQQNACEDVSYPPVKPTYFRWGKENHFPKHQAVGDMLVSFGEVRHDEHLVCVLNKMSGPSKSSWVSNATRTISGCNGRRRIFQGGLDRSVTHVSNEKKTWVVYGMQGIILPNDKTDEKPSITQVPFSQEVYNGM